jgi:hypothetical protein
MLINDARDLLDRIISENRQVPLRFESADGSLDAKVDGFIGSNALGEILIKSKPSGVNESFALKLALDFVCDYVEIPFHLLGIISGYSSPVHKRRHPPNIGRIVSAIAC